MSPSANCAPYQISCAATAWQTSMPMPPTVFSPHFAERRRNSVSPGLYTASNAAPQRASTFSPTTLSPAFGYMPTLVVFSARS